jgi:MFS family permease
MVLYAVAPGPLDLTTLGYGAMLMLISIGSVAGTFLTIPIQRWLGRRWAIGLNIFGNGLMFATPALTHNLWLIGGTLFLGGMGSPMWTITAAALQGRIVPPELQGRTNASYRILSIGMSALGPILGGLLCPDLWTSGSPRSLRHSNVATVYPFLLDRYRTRDDT